MAAIAGLVTMRSGRNTDASGSSRDNSSPSTASLVLGNEPVFIACVVAWHSKISSVFMALDKGIANGLLYIPPTHFRMASLQREEVGENPARSRHCERMSNGAYRVSAFVQHLQVRPPLQPFFCLTGRVFPWSRS